MAEWSGYRYRIILGDLSRDEEPNLEFSICLDLDRDKHEFCQYNETRNYDLPWWRDVTYWNTHSFALCCWRWGLYVALRGRKTPSLTSPD